MKSVNKNGGKRNAKKILDNIPNPLQLRKKHIFRRKPTLPKKHKPHHRRHKRMFHLPILCGSETNQEKTHTHMSSYTCRTPSSSTIRAKNQKTTQTTMGKTQRKKKNRKKIRKKIHTKTRDLNSSSNYPKISEEVFFPLSFLTVFVSHVFCFPFQ